MSDADRVATPIEGGRRAQHKASTRRAIALAAQQLVRERGLDAVTVADIAEAADVAHRTFYRYFPSKEDALLLDLRDFLDDYVMLVESRPASEHPVDSMLYVVGLVAGLDIDLTALEWLVGLVEETSSVAGVQHRMMLAAQDRLTELFAERLGVDSSALEPRLCAAAGTAAFQSAVLTYARLPAERRCLDDLWDLGREALESYADGLRPRDEPANP